MNNVNASFAQFGKAFQEKFIQALLVDRQFAEQMTEVFQIEFIELKYLAFLAKRYFAYATKYKVFPTLQLLLTIIKDELKQDADQVLKEQIIEYLKRISSNPDVGDLEYIKEKSLEFCRKQALKIALEKAVDQMQENRYTEIVDTIKKATAVGTTPCIGHDFFNDYDSRFNLLERSAVPTGLKELDAVLNGGAGAGELSVIIGASGGGKCTSRNAKIKIKYPQIIINNVSYRPWDKLNTKRGNIFARDIVDTDELI